MEETSLASLMRQTRHAEHEIVAAASKLGIPVRYSQDGRVFYPSEVRLIYGELFPMGQRDEDMDVADVLAMYHWLTRRGLRLLESKLGVARQMDRRGEWVYSLADARVIISELEELELRDVGESLDPNWWPVVDDYCFLTEVNNSGPIYNIVRDMKYKPILDEFAE